MFRRTSPDRYLKAKSINKEEDLFFFVAWQMATKKQSVQGLYVFNSAYEPFKLNLARVPYLWDGKNKNLT